MRAPGSPAVLDMDCSMQNAELQREALRTLDEPLQSAEQRRQEELNSDLSSSSLASSSLPYSMMCAQPPSQISNVVNSYGGHDQSQAACRSQSQTCSSDSSKSYSSNDWNTQVALSGFSLPSLRDIGDASFWQPQYEHTYIHPTGSTRPTHSDVARNITLNGNGTYASTTGSHVRGGAEARDSEPDRLKHIDESIHCFWLVSENRMSQIQQDLNEMSASIKAYALEREHVGPRVSQILALQVRNTQECVRAAEGTKVIFSRIKTLEESMVAWQSEITGRLEAMQGDLRAGLETMYGLASKTRKTSLTKAKSEPAPAPTANKGQKRASSTRKKASPASAKKMKLAPVPEQEDDALVAPPSLATAVTTSRTKPHLDSSPDRAQTQQACYLQHLQTSRQSPEVTSRQARSQLDDASQRQGQYQSHSQPITSNNASQAFDQVPLPTTRTTTSYPHAPHQSLGFHEVSLID